MRRWLPWFGRGLRSGQRIGNGRRAERLSMAGAIALAALSIAPAPARAAPEFGIRVGSGIGDAANFDLVGLYGRWSASAVEPYLPMGFDARWELAWARWRAAGETIHLAAFGPIAEYPMTHGLWFSLGVQPTMLSKTRADGVNTGGSAQFTSHIGAIWHMTPRLRLGVRLQHTSNAGLYRPNPGVDMLTTGLSYRF